MKLFVGLGNPGGRHARNRHNVGFMAADRIADTHGFGPWRNRFQGLVAEGILGGEKCLLLKPMTYMNESGQSVGAALRFYKLDPGEVIVFHDEIDLAPGKMRVKIGGGAAGHNGIRSVSAHIGESYVRVRIGVGHPGAKHKVESYVLKDFSRRDDIWLQPLLDAIADAAPKLAAGDSSGFMNAVALKTRAEDRERPKAASGKERAPRSAQVKKRPTQRDLARRAAEQAEKRSEAKEAEAKSSGPFARLRSLFGGE